MAQFYTLDEAARVLGMSPEELKGKAQQREVRAFMDSGSWQFRVADVDELARRRGLGSDPDFSLSDPELSLSDLDLGTPAGSASDELDLSEFQLGTTKPTFGQPTTDLPAFPGDADKDVLLDDFSVPPGMGSASNSSSTILGLHSGGKLPSDSDVRLVPDNIKGASDSDVRLAPHTRRPSDSDVTLVKDDQSVQDFPVARGPGDTAVRQGPRLGSSAEVVAGSSTSDSDFELSPSSVIHALEPESGSDFELSALDVSDEFDATPLADPGDSDVTAAAPKDSGINLGRPSDSGINLGGVGDLNLDEADIDLAPLEDSGPVRPVAKPKPKAAEPAKPKAKAKPSLSATPPPSVKKGEKDIFEDTDFEVDAIGSDEADDRTVQLEANSDFDLDDSESASEVFALDEEDVDDNASTSLAPALAEDESGEFGDETDGGSGWDIGSDALTPSTAGSQGAVISAPRGDNAEWGGLWVGFLCVSTVLTLVLAFVSIDLVRNLYDFRGPGISSGIIKGIAGLFPK